MLPIIIGVPIFQIFIMSKIFTEIESNVAFNTESVVELVFLGTGKPTSMVQEFAVAILVMYVLISGIIAATTIISEKEEHTLMRIFTAPIKKSQFIIGSLIGQATLLFFNSFTIIYISYLLFNVDWGTSLGGLAFATSLLGFVSLSMAFVAGGLFKNSKIASGVLSFVIVVMTFISGGLTQNGGFGLASKFTINWWGFDLYMKVIEGNPLANSSFSIIVLTTVGVILTLLAIFIYGRENIYE